MPIKIAASEILPTIKKHKLDEAYNLSEDDLKAISTGVANEELSEKVNKMLLVEREHFPPKVKHAIDQNIKSGWIKVLESNNKPPSIGELVKTLERGIRVGTLPRDQASQFAENIRDGMNFEEVVANRGHVYKLDRIIRGEYPDDERGIRGRA